MNKAALRPCCRRDPIQSALPEAMAEGDEGREPPLMLMAISRRKRRNVQIVCWYEYQFEKVLVVLFVGSLSHEGSLSE